MEINPIKLTDVDFIKKLADESFGANYITTSDILSHLDSSDKFGFCLFDKQEFIGFLFLKTYSNDTIQNYFLTQKEWSKNYFNSTKTIAVITQIALTKKYRQQKLSTLLLHSSIEFIKTTCDTIISICWIKKESNNMKFLLLNNGFKNIKTLPNYWLHDSIEKGYCCEICGTPPCQCGAEVFELKSPSII
ncbi:MAG: hypothetical protein HYU68_02695 [Bacteroidetes bacterium]|nr:hypothetical protein [Bacteroidota bacterium]